MCDYIRFNTNITKNGQKMATYNKKTVNKILDYFRSDSYTVTQVCKMVGLTRNTFYDWIHKYPKFKEALDLANEERMEFFVTEAKNSLLKKIQGYTVTETRTTTVPSKEKDKDGKVIPRIKEQTSIKKHIQPDTASVIFTLTNGDPDNWKNKQFQELTGKGGKPLVAEPIKIEVIDNINKIAKEED